MKLFCLKSSQTLAIGCALILLKTILQPKIYKQKKGPLGGPYTKKTYTYTYYCTAILSL